MSNQLAQKTGTKDRMVWPQWLPTSEYKIYKDA